MSENEKSLDKDLDLAAQEWKTDPVATIAAKQIHDAPVGSLSEDENDETDNEESSRISRVKTQDLIAEAKGTDSPAPVTFIADPYGFNTREIEKAQNDDEFLIEEAPLDIQSLRARMHVAETEEDAAFESTPEQVAENDALLDKLEISMKAESAKHAEDLETSLSQESEEIAAALEAKMKADIEEDQALEAALEAAKLDEVNGGIEIDEELQAALPKNPAENLEAEGSLADMESAIESLLFIVEKPMSAVKLQELLGPEISFNYFQEALTNLKTRYQSEYHGFELVEVAGGYQFRTKPLRAALAKKLARVQFQRLSSGAMETLAIITYRQPTLKETVDEVRGVDSSHFIRTLLDRKLIRISGRSELPGRPMLYETTEDFLQVFSLKDLTELPALSEIEQMVPSSQSDHEEDPRIKQMRKLVSDMKADVSVSLLYDPKEDEQFLKDIRERVKSIEVTTPTLQAQDDAAKAQKLGLGTAPGLRVAELNVAELNVAEPIEGGEQLPLSEQQSN